MLEAIVRYTFEVLEHLAFAVRVDQGDGETIRCDYSWCDRRSDDSGWLALGLFLVVLLLEVAGFVRLLILLGVHDHLEVVANHAMELLSLIGLSLVRR